jgi:catechol 2,3-dioxygenase-like lactoylglutathione lyase family enzyme
MATFPAPAQGILLTHFIVSSDIERCRRFYVDVLGGEALLAGDPSIVALANGWITISVGGGPTADKPNVTLEPPSDPDRVSGFLNIRVADIASVYKEWSARGAEFLTPPIDRGSEIRCYMRDPDGRLIEVGQLVRGVVAESTSAGGCAQETTIELFRHPLYTFTYDSQRKVIEFVWTAKTEQMQMHDYQEALQNFAGFAFDNPTTGLLVDVREFRYRPSAELGNWRDEVISPRYVKAGVKKFAYVAHEGMLQTMKGAMHGRERGFEEEYFSSRSAALDWLVA